MTHLECKTLYTLDIKGIEPLAEKGMFRGYASTPSMDKIKDIVLSGAFENTLQKWEKDKEGLPNIYEEHDRNHFIGTCKKLSEDAKGLYMEGKLFIEDIPRARHVYNALVGGSKYGLSIGFHVKKYALEKGVRLIKQLDLVEISIVNYPCNAEAKIYEFKTDHDPTDLSALHQLCKLIASIKKAH
jgi:hypothetical protein